MKRCLFVFVGILLMLSANAQTNTQKVFVLDEFEEGKALYVKDNQATEGKFNYETIMEMMLFITPDSAVYELARPDIVSHVIIGSRIFEHINKSMFYERINVNNGSFYVRWKSKVISKKEGPYGSTAETVRIDDVSQLISSRSVYDLKSAEKIKVEANNYYYIKQKDKFKQFDSFNSLAKLFKKQEKEIKAFVKDNDLNFRKLDDVKKVVEYAFGLNK